MSIAGRGRLVCVALTFGVLALSGCERAFNVYFVNPCDHPVAISTFSLPENEIQEGRPPDYEAKLPAQSIVKVPGAFTDLSPRVTTRVEGCRVLSSDVRHLVHDTIIIPTDFC